MQQKSRCIYCGSLDIGKNCRYAPHGVHFHPNDSTKCAYCKSPNFGKGCKINPTSDLHIHGINYNSMFKESVQGLLDGTLLLNDLKKEYGDFLCCKLGIIDSHGNRIKSPITEAEQASYTPYIKTIIKLKKYLGSKVELIQSGNELSSVVAAINESSELRDNIFLYQQKITDAVNGLYKIFEEAHECGIPAEILHKLIKA